MTDLGSTIRWARKRAGMTQADLARALDKPQPTIARIENGAVLPRTATLLAILDATGMELIVEPKGAAPDEAEIRKARNIPPATRVRQALGRPGRDTLTSPTRMLRRLRRFGVPFVLIGEMAEAAHGAPVKLARVVEICHAQTDEAHERLATALNDLGATGPAAQPEVKTDTGLLRLQAQTAAGDDYDTLMRNAARILIDNALQVRVASVHDLVRIRRAKGAPEDLAAAAVLRALDD